jgi:hypothetical protein
LNKKGDLAITTIAVIFITIISIVLLLALFGMKLPGFAKDIYCKTIYVVFRSGIDEGGEADTYCKRELSMNVNVIESEQEFLYDFSEGNQVKRLKESGTINITVPKSRLIDSRMILKSETDTTINMTFNPGGIILDIPLLAGNEPHEINFTSVLNESMMNCEPDPCTINISLNFSGILKAYNLNISYEKCFVENQIIASMLACWKKSSLGKLNKNIMCDTLTLSNDCPEAELSKNKTVEIMEEQNINLALPPAKIDWKLKKAAHGMNILVEYDSKNRQIRVS